MRSGVWACCMNDIRRLFSTPRTWAVAIVLLLVVDGELGPVKQLMADEGLLISWPGMITYLLNDSLVTFSLGMLHLMLLFDIPLTDETQRYIITRVGRGAWSMSHVIYVLVASAIFLLTFALAVGWMIVPYIDWSTGWSSGLRALVEDGMFEVYDSMLNYDVWIMRSYQPVSGALVSLGLHYVGFSMLALLMGCTNVLFDTRLGFIAGALPLLIDSVAEEYIPTEYYYAMPASLMRLSMLDYGDGMGRPTLIYGAALLLLIGILLACATVFLCRRKEIRL